MIDLALVSFKELADEIMNRSSGAIMMLKTIEETEVYFNWSGDYYSALGMCVEMQNKIKEDGDMDD